MARKNDRPGLGDRIDQFIGIFSPETAARRQFARYVTKHMLGAYRGADRGRLRGNWVPGGGSADQDLLPDLPALRERSRDLVRNDGIACGAIETIVTNVIGSGIHPQSRIDMETLKINEEYAEKLMRQIDKIWERWVEYADAGDRMNFYELEELVERQRFVNGEALVIPLYLDRDKSTRKRPYSFALQVVESDRMSTPGGMSSDRNIRDGVELGKYGEPIAYYIRKTHPGDYMFKRAYGFGEINDYEVYKPWNDLGEPKFFHLYHSKRSGQSRGEPFLAPVLNVFKDRSDYMEAEMVAARVAACFAVFIKKDLAQLSALNGTSVENDKRLSSLSPGIVEYLNPGESIESFSPNRPGGTFGIFMERILREAASGINLAYEVVAKDFSRSNYSNTRAALIESRRFFGMQQEFCARRFVLPVFRALIEEAYLRGELPILDFYANRAAYVKGRIITPGWQWVDPEKEVNASVTAIDNNLSTISDETASQGLRWDDVLEQRAREEKKRKELEQKYGVDLSPKKSADTQPKKEKKDVKDNDQEDKPQEDAQ